MQEYKNFKLGEFACKCGCGQNKINPDFVAQLDKARDYAEIPFVITSGYRCASHNREVGGVEDSAHTIGLAADIAAPDSQTMFIIIKSLLIAGFDRIGINFDKMFIHVDVDRMKPKGVIFHY